MKTMFYEPKEIKIIRTTDFVFAMQRFINRL